MNSSKVEKEQEEKKETMRMIEQNQENREKEEVEIKKTDGQQEIEKIKYQNQILYQQMIKVGNFGYKTENMREKVLLTQTNGIFTIVSIYSIAILYVIALKIINIEGCRLYLFIGLIYIFIILCLLCAFLAQIQGNYEDMGTIKEMDPEYTKALKNGIPLDTLYVRDLHNVHINRQKINDKRKRYISLSFIFLIISVILPIILVSIYYL